MGERKVSKMREKSSMIATFLSTPIHKVTTRIHPKKTSFLIPRLCLSKPPAPESRVKQCSSCGKILVVNQAVGHDRSTDPMEINGLIWAAVGRPWLCCSVHKHPQNTESSATPDIRNCTSTSLWLDMRAALCIARITLTG